MDHHHRYTMLMWWGRISTENRDFTCEGAWVFLFLLENFRIIGEWSICDNNRRKTIYLILNSIMPQMRINSGNSPIPTALYSNFILPWQLVQCFFRNERWRHPFVCHVDFTYNNERKCQQFVIELRSTPTPQAYWLGYFHLRTKCTYLNTLDVYDKHDSWVYVVNVCDNPMRLSCGLYTSRFLFHWSYFNKFFSRLRDKDKIYDSLWLSVKYIKKHNWATVLVQIQFSMLE